ncbi:hypothetical protein CVT24_008283 [Panaeolus cyanescens]|uniref:Integrase core domain-containing protein n=1 Tax=Panaeolus cyanescens TaxID=181874 RepID=A0A409YQH5_9AGAR|nr:hypothetical protein CVT24_008283 [Panaeolus cyanescens]
MSESLSATSHHSANHNNPKGRNQYRATSILDAIPDISDRLQTYINQGARQKDIPRLLERDCNEIISLSSVKKLMKKFNIVSVYRPQQSAVDQGSAILKVLDEDPLGRLGCRSVKEKLALQGVHVTRDFTMKFMQAENPSLTAGRHPQTRKTHKHTLWSSGPNEEWCLDGHEKILLSMGIAVYGIIDKFSRMELDLVAVPNARDRMPLSTTSDKGSEVGQLISLVQALRKKNQPYISEDQVPSHSAVKSLHNITRERGWRPIWEKTLANILHFFRTGQGDAGYQANDGFHVALGQWLWAKIVQKQLDQLLIENQYHRVRGQLKTLLPSDARHIDIYTMPEDYGAQDQKIPIPSEDVDKLLAEYDDSSLFQFVSPELDILFTDLYSSIDTPALSPSVGWSIFHQMLSLHLLRRAQSM